MNSWVTRQNVKQTLEHGVLDSEGRDGHTQEEGYMVKVLNLDPLPGR